MVLRLLYLHLSLYIFLVKDLLDLNKRKWFLIKIRDLSLSLMTCVYNHKLEVSGLICCIHLYRSHRIIIIFLEYL